MTRKQVLGEVINFVDIYGEEEINIQDFYNNVGINLRKRRRELDISQDALGKKLGVTAQQVQKHEKGTSKMYIHTLVSLSEILDVDISYFLRKPESKAPFVKKLAVRENGNEEKLSDLENAIKGS